MSQECLASAITSKLGVASAGGGGEPAAALGGLNSGVDATGDTTSLALSWEAELRAELDSM